MNEQAYNLAEAAGNPEPAKKHNRGWFRSSDPRINRAGRPKDAQAAARRARAGQPLAGRLKTLFVPEQDFRQSLNSQQHPWVMNLPDDFRVVALALDPARKGVLVTVHSNSFAFVQAGEKIPELAPEYNSLKWRHRPIR